MFRGPFGTLGSTGCWPSQRFSSAVRQNTAHSTYAFIHPVAQTGSAYRVTALRGWSLALTLAVNPEETHWCKVIRDRTGGVVNIYAVRHGEDIQELRTASRTFMSSANPRWVKWVMTTSDKSIILRVNRRPPGQRPRPKKPDSETQNPG